MVGGTLPLPVGGAQGQSHGPHGVVSLRRVAGHGQRKTGKLLQETGVRLYKKEKGVVKNVNDNRKEFGVPNKLITLIILTLDTRVDLKSKCRRVKYFWFGGERCLCNSHIWFFNKSFEILKPNRRGTTFLQENLSTNNTIISTSGKRI